MSKGLDALNNLRCMLSLSQDCNYNEGNDLCNIIEQELKELEERREMMKRFNDACVPTILDDETGKKLKVLEIIKEKRVNVWAIDMSENATEYNFSLVNDIPKPISQEEYDLLKEVLL